MHLFLPSLLSLNLSSSTCTFSNSSISLSLAARSPSLFLQNTPPPPSSLNRYFISLFHHLSFRISHYFIFLCSSLSPIRSFFKSCPSLPPFLTLVSLWLACLSPNLYLHKVFSLSFPRSSHPSVFIQTDSFCSPLTPPPFCKLVPYPTLKSHFPWLPSPSRLPAVGSCGRRN